jgi:DNA (cytosine-5)-methyltransferase 1
MTNNKHKFPYKWNLADGYPAKGIAKNECNVFGTFICGGGSTMGYKLAGFNHLGGVEIDVKVADVYKENHKPECLFVEDIRAFNKRTDLPTELYNLDILDGSPPCSTFSMAGSREKAWGKTKQFREGQAMQTLDDLVFVYCDTIIKLQPKVFLLENVKGIIQGNAKAYSKAIVKKMQEAGYTVQVFCLNAASMGVPQKRERVFFIGHKKEFLLPKLRLEFNEEAILFGEIMDKSDTASNISDREMKLFDKRIKADLHLGMINNRHNNSKSSFTTMLQKSHDVAYTITSSDKNILFDIPRYVNNSEAKLIGSYPLDYNFKTLEPKYLIGMSVPPVMTAQISHQIYLQWLSKIKQ